MYIKQLNLLIFGQKKCVVKKILGENIFGPKKNWIENDLIPKKIVKKVFIQKLFMKKNVRSQNNLYQKIVLGQK